jgi:acetamidase/formamidase
MQSMNVRSHSTVKKVGGVACVVTSLVLGVDVSSQDGRQGAVLQPMGTRSFELPEGAIYVPSTPDTVRWGSLPNRDSEALLTVSSGATVTFDTISHEGILEDQGRNPERYFGAHGIAPGQVLEDARIVAASGLIHDFDQDGPHVVTGPVAIEGARPGDVLKIDVLSLIPRVPYGVISSRHGKGALPGEFPENAGRQGDGSAERPELYNNASVFAEIEETRGAPHAILRSGGREEVRFPIDPFMGIMGVAPDTSETVNSIPPAAYGGNLDINELGVGSTLYLPVQVPGALFYVGDPHYAQGDGEVALTALEAPLRATFRLTLLAAGDAGIPGGSPFTQPFGESGDYWIPIGLDPDLDEAMKQAVRESIKFLSESLGIDRTVAYAYLSAATDFEISQVVDRTKGVHALIRKTDFPGTTFQAR